MVSETKALSKHTQIVPLFNYPGLVKTGTPPPPPGLTGLFQYEGAVSLFLAGKGNTL